MSAEEPVPELPVLPEQPGDSGEPAGRPWFRTGWFLFATGGVAVYLGLQFVGLIAVVLLVGDRTRERSLRIGAAVLIFWWTFTVATAGSLGNGAVPYLHFALLAISAVFLGRTVLDRREQPWRLRLGPSVLLLLAAVLAVVHLVPYGVRSPSVDRVRAVQLVAEERRGDAEGQIRATKALPQLARTPVLQKPFWLVATFEPHPDRAETDGGEPCFRRIQTYVVDALDRQVRRSDDLIEAEGEDDEDDCLEVDAATVERLVDLPTA